MPWLTPDDTIGELCAYRVYLPYNLDLESAYLGALLDLGRVENWETWGSKTPEECAQAFQAANELNMRLIPMVPVGTILWGGWSSTPDGFLLCDGSQYNTADYPELYNAIGFTWGGSGTVFYVPDLADRFIVGSGGDFSLADTGGEKEHTLSTSEIPSHHHTISQPITTLNDVPLGTTPVLTPGISSQNTGDTGGGNSHNNMPPYMALTPVISYR